MYVTFSYFRVCHYPIFPSGSFSPIPDQPTWKGFSKQPWHIDYKKINVPTAQRKIWILSLPDFRLDTSSSRFYTTLEQLPSHAIHAAQKREWVTSIMMVWFESLFTLSRIQLVHTSRLPSVIWKMIQLFDTHIDLFFFLTTWPKMIGWQSWNLARQ